MRTAPRQRIELPPVPSVRNKRSTKALDAKIHHGLPVALHHRQFRMEPTFLLRWMYELTKGTLAEPHQPTVNDDRPPRARALQALVSARSLVDSY